MNAKVTPRTRARRGDLAVLVSRTSTSYVVGGRQEEEERVEVGVVTSITRDGEIKAVAIPFSSDDVSPQPLPLRSRYGLTSVMLVSAENIEVDAALAAYREHRWNDESTMVRPLASVEQAREMLRPFRKGGGDGSEG